MLDNGHWKTKEFFPGAFISKVVFAKFLHTEKNSRDNLLEPAF